MRVMDLLYTMITQKINQIIQGNKNTNNIIYTIIYEKPMSPQYLWQNG